MMNAQIQSISKQDNKDREVKDREDELSGMYSSIITPIKRLLKGGIPAAPSGTATLLRLSPSYRFYPRPLLAVTDFRHPQLPWLDGRCVQGPGTYSPDHC